MLKSYLKIFVIVFALIFVACGDEENVGSAENSAGNIMEQPAAIAHPLHLEHSIIETAAADSANFSQEVITLGEDAEVFTLGGTTDFSDFSDFSATTANLEIIPPRERYYIIIRGVPLQLHPDNQRTFGAPVRGELAFVGREPELRIWHERQRANDTPTTEPRVANNAVFPNVPPLSEVRFFAVNLYNADDLRVSTFIRIMDNQGILANLNPEEDVVEFVGTWGQIVDENLVDLTNTELSVFFPRVSWDEWQAVAVRTRNNAFFTIIPIQNPLDWRFVLPTTVMLLYENGQIILRLYDENQTLMSVVVNENYTFTSHPRLSIAAFGTVTELTRMGF
ncbi:MAG: hypothetical protein FWG68_07070 [Defluviitaleaceae bacterium]|nr:hypothetical protein [Defluviitaleaceae bacterium]